MSDFRILSGLMAEENLRDRLDCWGYRWHHTDRGRVREDQSGVATSGLPRRPGRAGATTRTGCCAAAPPLSDAMAMLPSRTRGAIKDRARLIGHPFRKAKAAA